MGLLSLIRSYFLVGVRAQVNLLFVKSLATRLSMCEQALIYPINIQSSCMYEPSIQTLVFLFCVVYKIILQSKYPCSQVLFREKRITFRLNR